MKFKTQGIAKDSLLAVEKKIREKFPEAKLELLTETTDQVLHVHGVPEDSKNAAEIERNIAEAGFKGSWIQQGINNL